MAAKPSALATASPAARVGIGVGVGVLLALGYWVIFYSDVSAKIESARKQQNSLRTDLANQQQAQASYFADRDDLAMRQQRQRELNKALPAETEPASFLSALQQVANVSGVDLRGWQPQDEKIETFYSKSPLKIEIGGRFHQIAKFAFEVGRVERIINLENIELEDPKLEGDSVVLKAKCLATAFHAAKPKPQPAQTAGVPGGAAPPAQGAVTPQPAGGRP